MADDRQAKEIIRRWETDDKMEDLRRRHGRYSRLAPSGGRFVNEAILAAGYYDLAIAATAAVAVSIDRRHRTAVEARLKAGEARPLGGHYALGLLLPTEFTWSDVPDLRKHRALRDYRAIMSEVEAEALRTSRSAAEIDEGIHREYERRLARASAKGVPFAGKAALTAVGFVLGTAAETTFPLVGGGVVAAGGLAAGEVLAHAIRPRWLVVDRRIRGKRNGL